MTRPRGQTSRPPSRTARRAFVARVRAILERRGFVLTVSYPPDRRGERSFLVAFTASHSYGLAHVLRVVLVSEDWALTEWGSPYNASDCAHALVKKCRSRTATELFP